MSVSIFDNPLGRAQFRLLCSPRRHVQVAIAVPLILVALGAIFYRIHSGNLAQFGGTAFVVLMLIQSILLGMVASGAVQKAVQRDYTTGMIDSHRLTAMSGGVVAFGYLAGPTAQALLLAGEVVLLGAAVGAACGTMSVTAWVMFNGLLLVTAITLWAMTLFIAVCTSGKSNLLGLFAMLIGFAAALLVGIVPGLRLLLGPVGIMDRVIARGVTGSVPDDLLIAPFVQVALTLTFLAAAARKVRRADVQGFDWRLGLLLLAECVLIGATGLWLRLRGIATPGGLSDLLLSESTHSNLEILCTPTILSLVALVPMSAALQRAALWRRRIALDPQADLPKPASAELIVLLACLLVLVQPLIIAYQWTWTGCERLFAAEVCLLTGVLGVAGMMRISYRRSPRASATGFTVLFFWWVLPIVGSMIWRAYMESRGEEVPLPVARLLSPVGLAWEMLVPGGGIDYLISMAVQITLVAAVWLIGPRRSSNATSPLAQKPQ